MKQYAAAISDLFRENREYREERILLETGRGTLLRRRIQQRGRSCSPVPDNAGVYEVRGCPSVESCFDPLETKLLAPHLGPPPPVQVAPQAVLTSGQTGASFDLETTETNPPWKPRPTPKALRL